MKLYNEDCFNILPNIPDNSIDLILTDPPYETNNWSRLKWDNLLDFEEMWKHIKRIRKDKIAIVIFGQEPFSTRLRYSNLEEFKYDWIWIKNSKGGFLNAKVKPLKNYEIISIFSNGTTAPTRLNNMPYYPQGLLPYKKFVKQKKTQTYSMGASIRKDNVYTRSNKNYPSDVLYFSEPTEKKHPTEKPLPLLAYLIKTYTKENDTILDFTMGSGSTGVACKNLNREFIGIEKDEKYFDIAKNRIESSNYQSNLLSFS